MRRKGHTLTESCCWLLWWCFLTHAQAKQTVCKLTGDARIEWMKGCVASSPDAAVFVDSHDGLVLFNRTSRTMQRFAWQGDERVQGVPYAVAQMRGDADTLVVVESESGCIRKVSLQQGTAFSLVCQPGTFFPSDLVALDATTVLVTDPEHGVVFKYNMNSQAGLVVFAGTWRDPYDAVLPTKDGSLQDAVLGVPFGICADHTRGLVFVLDTLDNSIRQISLQSGNVSTLFYAGEEMQDPRIIRMWGSQRKLLISDAWNYQIKVYDLLNNSLSVLIQPMEDRKTVWALAPALPGNSNDFLFGYTSPTDSALYVYSEGGCLDQNATWLAPRNLSIPQLAANQCSAGLGTAQLALSHYVFTQGTSCFLNPDGILVTSDKLPPSHDNTATRIVVQLLNSSEVLVADNIVVPQQPALSWEGSDMPADLQVFVKTPTVYQDTCRVQLEYVTQRPVSVGPSIWLQQGTDRLPVPCSADAPQHGVCTVQGDACKAFAGSDWESDRMVEVHWSGGEMVQTLKFQAHSRNGAVPRLGTGVYVRGPVGPVIPEVDAWVNFSVYAKTDAAEGPLRSWSFTFQRASIAVESRVVAARGFYVQVQQANVSGWQSLPLMTAPVTTTLLCTIQVRVNVSQLVWGQSYEGVLHSLEVLSLVNVHDKEILSQVAYGSGDGAGFQVSAPPQNIGLYAWASGRNYVMTKPDRSEVGSQGSIRANFIMSVFGQAMRNASDIQCESGTLKVEERCNNVMPDPRSSQSPALVHVKHGGFAAKVAFVSFQVSTMILALKDAQVTSNDVALIRQFDCLRLQTLVQWRGHPSKNLSLPTDVTKTPYRVHVQSSNSSRLLVVDQAWVCAVGQVLETATLSAGNSTLRVMINAFDGTISYATQIPARTLQHAGSVQLSGDLSPQLSPVQKVGLVGDTHSLVHGVSLETGRMVLALQQPGLRRFTLLDEHVGKACINNLYVGMNYAGLVQGVPVKVTRNDNDPLYSVLGGEEAARLQGFVKVSKAVKENSVPVLTLPTGHSRPIHKELVEKMDVVPINNCQPELVVNLKLHGLETNASYTCTETQALIPLPVLLANPSVEAGVLRRISRCSSGGGGQVFESLTMQAAIQMTTGERFLVPTDRLTLSSSGGVLAQRGHVFTGVSHGQAGILVSWDTLQGSVNITVDAQQWTNVTGLSLMDDGQVRIVFEGGVRGELTSEGWVSLAAGYSLEQHIFGQVVQLDSTHPAVVAVLPNGTLETVANGHDETLIKIRLSQHCGDGRVFEVLSPLQGNLAPVEKGALDLGSAATPVPIPSSSTNFDVRVAGPHLQAFDIVVAYDPQHIQVVRCVQKSAMATFFWCTNDPHEGQVSIVGFGAVSSPHGQHVVATIEFGVQQGGLTSFHASCRSLVFAAPAEASSLLLLQQQQCPGASVQFKAPSAPQYGVLLQGPHRRNDMWHTSWRQRPRAGRALLQAAAGLVYGDVDGDGAFTLLDLVVAYLYHRKLLNPTAGQLGPWQRAQLHAVADPSATSGMRDVLYLGSVYVGLIPFVAAVNMTSDLDALSLEVQLYNPPAGVQVLFVANTTQFSQNGTLIDAGGGNQLLQIAGVRGQASSSTWSFAVSQGHEAASVDDILQRIVMHSEPAVGVAFVIQGPSNYKFPFFSANPAGSVSGFRPYRTLDILATDVCKDTYRAITLKAHQANYTAAVPDQPVTEVVVPFHEMETYSVLLRFNTTKMTLSPVVCMLAHGANYSAIHSLALQQEGQAGERGQALVYIPVSGAAQAQQVAYIAAYVMTNTTTTSLAYLGGEIVWKRHQQGASPTPPPNNSGSSLDTSMILTTQFLIAMSVLWVILEGSSDWFCID